MDVCRQYLTAQSAQKKNCAEKIAHCAVVNSKKNSEKSANKTANLQAVGSTENHVRRGVAWY
ncbi:hypothetical protein CSU32_10955 [Salmonella enterica subsp. diarizonae]|nr:hypothetical protein [Salmonella enterica subsp. diarizonae]ECI3361046.1 hypothetical protein [Salmonella enterica subsp. diarizonae]